MQDEIRQKRQRQNSTTLEDANPRVRLAMDIRGSDIDIDIDWIGDIVHEWETAGVYSLILARSLEPLVFPPDKRRGTYS